MDGKFDAIVIGGGFYGLQIAVHLRRAVELRSVLVLERESVLMNRASYVNQARVHNGYHYPRSLLTGFRSRASLPLFVEQFREAVDSSFTHYYAIATRMSKTSPRQFELFCDRIGASLSPVTTEERSWFDGSMIRAAYSVEEPAFNARTLLDLTLEQIRSVGGIEISTSNEVVRVEQGSDRIRVVAQQGRYESVRVVNATYAGINQVLARSQRPAIEVQHEVAEMALVELPDPFRGVAVTVMDGPFFSLMPFPSSAFHTFSHVRYTPHARWKDSAGETASDPYASLQAAARRSMFPAMIADASRYMPMLRNVKRADSIWEIKTVLAASEHNDSRPIVFRPDPEIRGLVSVLGGKIDNIFDVLAEVEALYGK